MYPQSKYLTNEGGAKLSNNIRSERARLGLSQDEFASILDVDASTLRRWESDESSIKACHLKRMSELFKCTVDYLLGMSEERTVSRTKTS